MIPADPRGVEDGRGAPRDPEGQGVEERVVDNLDSPRPERLGQSAGVAVHPFGNGSETFRSVVRRVETRDDGEEHLCGADVARRLLPANMLLTRLERQAQRGSSRGVARHPHEAARQGALVRLSTREEGRVGTAVAERDSETLGTPDHEIGTDLTRGSHHGQREQIHRHGDQRTRGVRRINRGGVIAQRAARPWVLEQEPEQTLGRSIRGVAHDHLDPERLRPTAHHCDGLRMAILVDEEPFPATSQASAHCHGLSCGRRLVEQRRIRKVHPGEVGDHRLEVQQCFESTLGDLRLIRRVRRVPTGIL